MRCDRRGAIRLTLRETRNQKILGSWNLAPMLLARFLPRRDVTADEVIRQMEVRHSQRQVSIDQAYARQEVNQNLGPPPRVTK